jgi:hypothetical protein
MHGVIEIHRVKYVNIQKYTARPAKVKPKENCCKHASIPLTLHSKLPPTPPALGSRLGCE